MNLVNGYTDSNNYPMSYLDPFGLSGGNPSYSNGVRDINGDGFLDRSEILEFMGVIKDKENQEMGNTEL